MVAQDNVAARASGPEDPQDPGEGEVEAILVIAEEDEEVVVQINENGELEEIKTFKKLKREVRNRGSY